MFNRLKLFIGTLLVGTLIPLIANATDEVRDQFNRALISGVGDAILGNDLLNWSSNSFIKSMFIFCFAVAIFQAIHKHRNGNGLVPEFFGIAVSGAIALSILGGITYTRFLPDLTGGLPPSYNPTNSLGNKTLDRDLFNRLSYEFNGLSGYFEDKLGPTQYKAAMDQLVDTLYKLEEITLNCAFGDEACLQKEINLHIKETGASQPVAGSDKTQVSNTKEGSSFNPLNGLSEMAHKLERFVLQLYSPFWLIKVVIWFLDIIRAFLSYFTLITFGLVTAMGLFFCRIFTVALVIPSFRKRIMATYKLPLSATLYGFMTSLIIGFSTVIAQTIRSATIEVILQKVNAHSGMNAVETTQLLIGDMLSTVAVLLIQVIAISKVPGLCYKVWNLQLEEIANFGKAVLEAGLGMAKTVGGVALAAGAAVATGGASAAMGLAKGGSVASSLAKGASTAGNNFSSLTGRGGGQGFSGLSSILSGSEPSPSGSGPGRSGGRGGSGGNSGPGGSGNGSSGSGDTGGNFGGGFGSGATSAGPSSMGFTPGKKKQTDDAQEQPDGPEDTKLTKVLKMGEGLLVKGAVKATQLAGQGLDAGLGRGSGGEGVAQGMVSGMGSAFGGGMAGINQLAALQERKEEKRSQTRMVDLPSAFGKIESPSDIDENQLASVSSRISSSGGSAKDFAELNYLTSGDQSQLSKKSLDAIESAKANEHYKVWETARANQFKQATANSLSEPDEFGNRAINYDNTNSLIAMANQGLLTRTDMKDKSVRNLMETNHNDRLVELDNQILKAKQNYEKEKSGTSSAFTSRPNNMLGALNSLRSIESYRNNVATGEKERKTAPRQQETPIKEVPTSSGAREINFKDKGQSSVDLELESRPESEIKKPTYFNLAMEPEQKEKILYSGEDNNWVELASKKDNRWEVNTSEMNGNEDPRFKAKIEKELTELLSDPTKSDEEIHSQMQELINRLKK